MLASPQRSGRFPRAERLRTSRQFQAVKAQGRRWDAGFFIAQVHWRRAEEAAEAPRRVGIVASRRIGNAVARQRSKRLLREAWRWERNLLPDGVDVVLVGRRGLPNASSAQVRAQMRRAFEQIVRRGPRPAAPEPEAGAPQQP